MDRLSASEASPLLLRGRAQHYDWGSFTAIPELLGVEPDGRPWAELWFGAHPAAPADVLVAGEWQPLDAVIAVSPEALLGPACRERFGDQLPFLLKILAAGQPLSLQVHPSTALAEEGFAREEAAGVPVGAPERTYRDRWHKPEVLCALTPFEALSGFRSAEGSEAVLAAFGLDDVAARVRVHGLAAAFWSLWSATPAEREALARAAVAAAPAASAGPFAAEAGWVSRLGALHPGDVGIVAALLCNLVVLEPGQALYAPAQRLHAYLHGLGVELMATSDNVVRGGLTTKHVALAELERVLLVVPEGVVAQDETAGGWMTPAPEFHLSRLAPGVEAQVDGPEILLFLDGPGSVAGVPVERGGALFVPASLDRYQVGADAAPYRAQVGFLAR